MSTSIEDEVSDQDSISDEPSGEESSSSGSEYDYYIYSSDEEEQDPLGKQDPLGDLIEEWKEEPEEDKKAEALIRIYEELKMKVREEKKNIVNDVLDKQGRKEEEVEKLMKERDEYKTSETDKKNIDNQIKELKKQISNYETEWWNLLKISDKDILKKMCDEYDVPPPIPTSFKLNLDSIQNKTINLNNPSNKLSLIIVSDNKKWDYEATKEEIILDKDFCFGPLEKITPEILNIAEKNYILCYLILKYNQKHILLGWTNIFIIVPTYEYQLGTIGLGLHLKYTCVPAYFTRMAISTLIKDYVITTILNKEAGIKRVSSDNISEGADNTDLAQKIADKFGLEQENIWNSIKFSASSELVIAKINRRKKWGEINLDSGSMFSDENLRKFGDNFLKKKKKEIEGLISNSEKKRAGDTAGGKKKSRKKYKKKSKKKIKGKKFKSKKIKKFQLTKKLYSK